MRNVKSKKLLRALIKLGFEVKAQSGTHVILRGFRDGVKRTFPVPIHHQIIPIGTFKSILKQAGVTEEELKEFL
ncbi:type II toxin-antitoxin system HicA family toxin [Candidatus Pacearchaeota archaeon]|nr:type II toxin-antitoxin system HicA family toxin [Candidatus Pacearchaeota archaeon]